MAPLSLLLWVVGVALVVVAVFQVRGPFSRLAELDRLADNARRYDSWRGGRRTAAEDGGPTGADIMRDMLRRKVLVWAAVAALGVILVFCGFALR